MSRRHLKHSEHRYFHWRRDSLDFFVFKSLVVVRLRIHTFFCSLYFFGFFVPPSFFLLSAGINSHAWAWAIHMVRPSIRIRTGLKANFTKGSRKKRHNPPLGPKKLMHSISDLCTFGAEYIATHFVYEINFEHTPLALRPCNY